MPVSDRELNSLLVCPNCGSTVLSSSATVSMEMYYDLLQNAWVPDFGDFDVHEAAKEALETFDGANGEVLCGTCDFEAEGMFFRSVITDPQVIVYRDDKVKEFRALLSVKVDDAVEAEE